MAKKITARMKNENIREQAINLLDLTTLINEENPLIHQVGNGEFAIPLVDLDGNDRWATVSITAKRADYDGEFEISEWERKLSKSEVEQAKKNAIAEQKAEKERLKAEYEQKQKEIANQLEKLKVVEGEPEPATDEPTETEKE